MQRLGSAELKWVAGQAQDRTRRAFYAVLTIKVGLDLILKELLLQDPV